MDTLTVFAAGLGTGAAAGIVVTLIVDDTRIRLGYWLLDLARAVRDEAARLVHEAGKLEQLARSIDTPTGEYPVVRPRLRIQPLTVRIREAIHEWALSAGPDRSETWEPGELARLTTGPGPDLSRRNWPLRKHIPTPVEVAMRLAQIPDPDRWKRIKRVSY